MSLPIGWGDRHNTMSEKDMKLGGAAATKFVSKNSYDGASSATYKTSDQVREHYLSEMERLTVSEANESDEPPTSETNRASDFSTTTSSSNVPDFWGSRQKERELQAKQMGVFARHAINIPQQQTPLLSSPVASEVIPVSSTQGSTTGTQSGNSLSPEVALVHIAINTLETMAAAMESNRQAKISIPDRTALANAMKRAMAALAKQSN